MSEKILKLAVLASGGGSTLQFILDAIRQGRLPAQVIAVLADRSCRALERAAIQSLPTQLLSRKALGKAGLDAALATELEGLHRGHGCELVLLAGYLSVIGPRALATELARRGRIWNMHPSLLPKFGGMGMHGIHVHRAVLRQGESVTGCTLHRVGAVLDGGPILAQREVDIRNCQTAEAIATAVQNLERQLLLEYLREFARRAQGGTVRPDDENCNKSAISKGNLP